MQEGFLPTGHFNRLLIKSIKALPEKIKEGLFYLMWITLPEALEA